MKRRDIFLAWMICSMVVAPPGFAAPTEKSLASVLQGVKELEKRVTLSETKISLGELIQKVAEQTGAPLTAARDVADEPVAVVVKEFPALELLEQLADLLDYRWSRRGGDGGARRRGDAEVDARRSETRDARLTPTPNTQHPTPAPQARYEIWQDLASKQREEALRQAVYGDVEKRFQEQLRRTLEVAALSPEENQAILKGEEERRKQFEKLTPEQRQALFNSPEERERMQRWGLARRVSSPIARTLALLIGRLTPQQWTVLRERGQLALSTDPEAGELRLPPEMASAFRSAKPTYYPPGIRMSFGEPGGEERMRQREKELQDHWAAATGFRVTLQMQAERLKTSGSLSVSANATAIRSGAPARAGFFGGGPGTSFSIGIGPVDYQRHALENTPERRAALEQDPILGVKKPFKPEAKPRTDAFGPGSGSVWSLRDLLPDLARTYGVHIIADAYGSRSQFFGGMPTTEPSALFTLLDRYLGGTQRWDRQGNLIRLRSRTWFLDRPREIPLRLIRRWKEFHEKQGALPLEEYVAMVTGLTDAQLEGINSLDSEFRGWHGLYEVYSGRHLLRLYATLTPAQRQALWQGQPIPVAQMAPQQRALFLAMLQDRNRYRRPVANLEQWAAGNLSMKAERHIRVVVRREGGGTAVRMERVPEPGAPGGAAAGAAPPMPPPAVAPPPAPAPPPGGAAVRPGGPVPGPQTPASPEQRHLVLQITFHLQHSPEGRDGFSFTVAPPP